MRAPRARTAPMRCWSPPGSRGRSASRSHSASSQCRRTPRCGFRHACSEARRLRLRSRRTRIAQPGGARRRRGAGRARVVRQRSAQRPNHAQRGLARLVLPSRLELNSREGSFERSALGERQLHVVRSPSCTPALSRIFPDSHHRAVRFFGRRRSFAAAPPHPHRCRSYGSF